MRFRNDETSVRLYQDGGTAVDGIVRVRDVQVDADVVAAAAGYWRPVGVEVRRAGGSRRLSMPPSDGLAIAAAVVAAPVASAIIARLVRGRSRR